MLTLFFRSSVFAIIFIILSGCVSKQPFFTITNQTVPQRIEQLKSIKQWKVTGKIAFLQESKRESANLTWQVDENKNKQQLDLNSYLGINVLHLESIDNQHIIDVDGKQYQGNNLDELIDSLTGMTLPTKALHSWLKSMPFQIKDTISIDQTTQLPKYLISHYNNKRWKISYKNYKMYNNIYLATKFTIETEHLTIKIALNNWLLYP